MVRSVDEKLEELRRRYPGYLRRVRVVYTMWAMDDSI